MRFWQKIFLTTLTILLFSLNIFSYIFIRGNLTSSLNKEAENRLKEYKLMCITFETSIQYKKYLLARGSFTEAEILSIFNDFSSGYPVNNPELQFITSEISTLTQDIATVSLISQPTQTLITISSIFEIDNILFKLTVSSDITDLYQEASVQIAFARKLSLYISLGAAVIVLIISLALTRRINTLRRSTQKMVHGIFFMRAKISSRDEIGGLAEDFNIMADTVESKVAELSQIADDRKRFIDNMAHEMKTPLTSIIGFADLLRKAKLDNRTKVEYADNIYREGKHLKNVSSKLMELILLGKTNPTLEQINPSDLLDEVYQSMEQICLSAGITLVLQKNPSTHIPIHIDLDIELIKSLIYNLIDNAIKASRTEDRILLSSGFTQTYTNSTEECFYIAVKDWGKGIPAEEINKITEPFYMLDKARTREHGGAGLGLALCSEIATLHNSELKIESAMGVGTEIKILFKEVLRFDKKNT